MPCMGCDTGCLGVCASACGVQCADGCGMGCDGAGCSGGCYEGCGNSCGEGCANSCEWGCSDDCVNGCRGDCRQGCLAACKTACNNACTAANAAQTISEIANLLIGNKYPSAEDFKRLKSALEFEYTRRGRNDFSTYSQQPSQNKPVAVEHGEKIVADCIKLGSTTITNNAQAGKPISLDPLAKACTYTSQKMNEVVPKN